MNRHFLTCSLLAVLTAASGCAMCGSPFDYTYSAYGGKWQRDDPVSGRVGSIFDPAGPLEDQAGATTAPTPAESPTPAGLDQAAAGGEAGGLAPPRTEILPPAQKLAVPHDGAPSPGTLLKP